MKIFPFFTISVPASIASVSSETIYCKSVNATNFFLIPRKGTFSDYRKVHCSKIKI